MPGAGSPTVQAGSASVRIYTVDERGRRCRMPRDVRTVLTDVLLTVTKGGADVYGDLHIITTAEGIITDALVAGKVVGTACYPLDSLIDGLGDLEV
jgi:hypothetical protein